MNPKEFVSIFYMVAFLIIVFATIQGGYAAAIGAMIICGIAFLMSLIVGQPWFLTLAWLGITSLWCFIAMNRM